MQQHLQYVVTLRIDRFMLDESARPPGSTGERALLSKSFCVAWSFVSQGPQSLQGSTPMASFHALGPQLVCDWKGFQGEVILDASVLSNFSARVLVLRIVEMDGNHGPHIAGEEGCSMAQVVTRLRALHRSNGSAFASATIDPGSFVKKPPRDYCVKMESNFTTVGKLYFHMSVESLEMKRFAQRTVIEKRLMLRVDRVVTSRSTSSVKSLRSAGGSASIVRSGETPASSTRSSPQAPALVPTFSAAMRTTSDMSTTSTEGSVGPLHTPPSSVLRPGLEYVVKLRLSSGRDVYRTPLSICDADGRVRWGYELTVPLPAVRATFPGQSSSSGDGEDAAGHMLPMPVEKDDMLSISSSGPGTPHDGSGGRVKLQVALMEGQQVVSAFAIDVAKLKSSKEWTEYVIPSPYSTVRRERDGTTSTVRGGVLFEMSVRQSETLRLQRNGEGGTATTETNSKGTSGCSTPVREATTMRQPVASSHRVSEGLPSAPAFELGGDEEAAPFKEPQAAPSAPLPATSRSADASHAFGDSLCSTPRGVVDAAQWTPPARPLPPARLSPSALPDRTLVLSDNFSPQCTTATLPPTPQVQSGESHSLGGIIGGGARRNSCSTSDPALGVRSDATSPMPPSSLQHTMRLEAPPSPPPQAASVSVGNPNHGTDPHWSATHDTPPIASGGVNGPRAHRRSSCSDEASVCYSDPYRSPDAAVSSSPTAAATDTAHEALLRRVEAQDKCIHDLQRQLATLQSAKTITPHRADSAVQSSSEPATEATALRGMQTGKRSIERERATSASVTGEWVSRRAGPHRTHSLSRDEPRMHSDAHVDAGAVPYRHSSRDDNGRHHYHGAPAAFAGAMMTPPKITRRGTSSSPVPHDPRGGYAAPSPLPGLSRRIGTSSQRDVQ